MHMSRWCDGDGRQRSRIGSLTDKDVKSSKTRAAKGATRQTCVIAWRSNHDRTTKLRLYRICVCSPPTHCCEAWTLNRTVIRSINGFNNWCLHVMTGEHYRETATAPAYTTWCWRCVDAACATSPMCCARLSGHRAATTCGNDVESFNVARQNSSLS